MEPLPADPVDHERWKGDSFRLFEGKNHPHPDDTRAFIDMREVLSEELYNAAHRWAKRRAEEGIEDRPGYYRMSRALAGGDTSNSDPVVMAVGKALEGEVSRIIGRRAWVTQASVCVYHHGVRTWRHRDVGYYRYFLAWPLVCDRVGDWPFYLERTDGGVDVLDNSQPDKALLIAGHDLHHWRDPYPGDKALAFFLRYTAYDKVRSHTPKEVDEISAVGWEELRGRSLNAEELESVKPRCTSQSLVNPESKIVMLPKVFTPEECDAILKTDDMPEWVTRRLYQVVKDTGPELRLGCGFAGHEHQLDIRFHAGDPPFTWRRDVDADKCNRTRVVVCLGAEGRQYIAFKDSHIKQRCFDEYMQRNLQLGDVILWRSDVEYIWSPSNLHLTAMYGLPEGFLERWT